MHPANRFTPAPHQHWYFLCTSVSVHIYDCVGSAAVAAANRAEIVYNGNAKVLPLRGKLLLLPSTPGPLATMAPYEFTTVGWALRRHAGSNFALDRPVVAMHRVSESTLVSLFRREVIKLITHAL